MILFDKRRERQFLQPGGTLAVTLTPRVGMGNRPGKLGRHRVTLMAWGQGGELAYFLT